jgi:O-antigen/teichoic acid export membrane protein
MPPGEYGRLALGVAVATFANQVFSGPLSGGAARFYAVAREQGELKHYLGSVYKLAFLASGLLLLLGAGITAVAGLAGAATWVALILAAMALSIASGYDSIASGIQNSARQRIVVALHAAIGSWGRFVVASALMLGFGPSSAIAMWGYVIATLVVLWSQYLFFRPIMQAARIEVSTSGGLQEKWQARIIHYSWPFAAWGVFTWFQLTSDRWALNLFASSSAVGFFAVLYQLGYYPVTFLTNMLVTLVSPILFERSGNADNQQRLSHASRLNMRILGLVFAGTALVFVATLFGHQWIFRILVARQYWGVSHFLPWLTLSGGIFAAGQILSLERMSRLDTKGLIAPKIVTAIVGSVLNILGAYLYGVAGVVAASVSFSLIYFAWLLFQHLDRITSAEAVPSRAESAAKLR